MTKTTDFDRWLTMALDENGPHSMPAHVVDDALTRADAIIQRRPLAPWLDRQAWPAHHHQRSPFGGMPRLAFVGGLGLLVAGILGSMFVGGPLTPAPGTSVTPSPAPSVTPVPSVDTTPTVVPGEPWIAYIDDGPTGYGVYLVRPDGLDAHRWSAPVPGILEHPDWSPDGARIAVDSVDGANVRDLWIADADGSDARLLVDCVAPCRAVEEPAWSPDGTSIAFPRSVLGPGVSIVSSLEIIDVATGATRVVLTMPSQSVVLAPRWAPDGHRLVVEVARLPADDFLVQPDGGAIGIVDLDAVVPGVQLLTGFDRFGQTPDWSPDGDWIVFGEAIDGDHEVTDLWLIQPDGTGLRALTTVGTTGGSANDPTFVPDGTRIVFALVRPGADSAVLASVSLDGTAIGPVVGAVDVRGGWPRLRPTP